MIVSLQHYNMHEYICDWWVHTTSGVRAVGTTLQHNTRRCEYKLIELGCSMVRDMRIDQDQRMSTRGRACRRGGPHAIRAPWGPSFRRHTPDQCPWTPVACKHRKTKILGHCTVLVDNSSKTLDNRALVVFALSLTATCLQLAIANVPPARTRTHLHISERADRVHFDQVLIVCSLHCDFNTEETFKVETRRCTY